MPPCTPGPISKLARSSPVPEDEDVVGAGGGGGDDPLLLLPPLPAVLLRVRSKIRSFFSAPPVASTCGLAWMGNATDRTM